MPYAKIATLSFMFFFTFFGYAEEKIYFLHIPKSGGTTFRYFLQDHFTVDQIGKVMDGFGWEQQINLHALQGKTLRYIQNPHTVFYYLKDYITDFTKVTFLRNPVDRILSEHRYIFDRGHKNVSNLLKQHFLPVEGDPIETTANIACRLLSKLDPLNPAISIEEHLKSAKEVLMYDFDFVGITERMEESVTLFCHMLGWKTPQEIPFYNPTNKKTSYPQSVLDAIAERNWADMELYRFAIELFEVQKQTIVPCLKEKNIQYLDQINYDFTGPLDGFGWCMRELWPEGTFRWLSSSERAGIHFPLLAGHTYILKMELYISSSLIKKLSISMNGTPLRYSVNQITFEGEYRWITCHAIIPRSLIKPAKESCLEIGIEDPDRVPTRDPYRGRCGARKISIATHFSHFIGK